MPEEQHLSTRRSAVGAAGRTRAGLLSRESKRASDICQHQHSYGRAGWGRQEAMRGRKVMMMVMVVMMVMVMMMISVV